MANSEEQRLTRNGRERAGGLDLLIERCLGLEDPQVSGRHPNLQGIAAQGQPALAMEGHLVDPMLPDGAIGDAMPGPKRTAPFNENRKRGEICCKYGLVVSRRPLIVGDIRKRCRDRKIGKRIRPVHDRRIVRRRNG
jgi:hypothetical protein